ncbi:MAG: hypothetical protein HQL56_19290, partial [Magnetococcales bacterium]|nr:hypothetical protein [Magnetococcales bacterium]
GWASSPTLEDLPVEIGYKFMPGLDQRFGHLVVASGTFYGHLFGKINQFPELSELPDRFGPNDDQGLHVVSRDCGQVWPKRERTGFMVVRDLTITGKKWAVF